LGPQELRRRQASLRGVRVGLSRQQTRLLEAYLAGVVDLATFDLKRNELCRREEEVLAREREVVAQGQRLVAVENIAHSATQILEQLSCGLGQASFEQRRELVELLIDRVVVTDDAVEIRYVVPTTEASTHTRFCQLRTDYIDAFPDPLTDGVARMTSGAPIDGAASSAGVLRDWRRHVVLSDGRDARPRVVGCVSAERPRVKATQARVIQQLRHRVALRRACRAGELNAESRPGVRDGSPSARGP